MLEIVFFNFAIKQTAACTQCFARGGKSMFQPRGSGLLQETLGGVARSAKALTLLMTKLCELRTGFLLEIL